MESIENKKDLAFILKSIFLIQDIYFSSLLKKTRYNKREKLYSLYKKNLRNTMKNNFITLIIILFIQKSFTTSKINPDLLLKSLQYPHDNDNDNDNDNNEEIVIQENIQSL